MWHSWLNGVVLTTCPSMWVRQRRLWWTSSETLVTTPHCPSTARPWRESAALNSWGCTSQRTSPGPPTLHHSPRRHNSAYTFSAGWKELVSLHPSSPLSTGEPLRVCWLAVSLSCTLVTCSYYVNVISTRCNLKWCLVTLLLSVVTV